LVEKKAGLLRGWEEKRVYACGRQGGVAGKLVADVTVSCCSSLALSTSRATLIRATFENQGRLINLRPAVSRRMAGSHSRNGSESRRSTIDGEEDDSLLGTALTVRPPKAWTKLPGVLSLQSPVRVLQGFVHDLPF
jgi:hypothetical protein